jgi:nucleotide-binding universal stress UspA family protein
MSKLQLQAKKVKAKFESLGLKDAPTIHCKNQIGNLSENVKDYLEKNEVWMIIMGTKRTDGFLNHFLFGSQTEMIVDTASCPVLLISDQTEYQDFKKIVFASAEFDSEDFKALNYIADLANPFKSEIIITHIDPIKKKEEERVEIPKEIYLSWSEMKYKNVSFHDIKSDDITESIKKFAQIEAIDVISLIYRKHTFFDQLFKESTIRKMLDYDKVPLLVFPKNYFDKD